ncbi:unnamed protein product [Mytilus edulis]|uniref:Uncharacterized protein n=1 Tax=Mytilus edulis TaxID=6550 RepID=A0A8S3RRU2_MYTED|nr:unnamed protein product [Mytilus edulis]
MDSNDTEEFQEASNQPIPSISAELQTNKRKRTNGDQASESTKLNVKLVRCQQHQNYLNKCKNRDTIQKTLRINIRPQVPDTTPSFLIKWETTQIEFSRKLVGLLQEYWQTRCETITTQIADMEKDLNSTTEPAKMELITNLIERTKISVEREIQNPNKNTT